MRPFFYKSFYVRALGTCRPWHDSGTPTPGTTGQLYLLRSSQEVGGVSVSQGKACRMSWQAFAYDSLGAESPLPRNPLCLFLASLPLLTAAV